MNSNIFLSIAKTLILLLFGLVFGCDKRGELPVYDFKYVYINNSESPIDFNVNYTNNVETFKIAQGDSIVFLNRQEFPGVFETVKSVGFKFLNSQKCVKYLNSNEGNIAVINQGIFNFKNYQNYNPPIKLQNTTFRYNIDTKDLGLAKACE